MERTRGRFGPLVLSTLACRLLAPERGALEAPVRSEIFGAARFSDHGRSLARAQEVAAPGELRSSFFPRLQENLDVLRDARRLLETLNLDSLTAGQALLMLVATTAPTPPAPALARPLPQPAD